MVNTEDFLSSVYGNDGEPLYFVTENGFYNSPLATGATAEGINPVLVSLGLVSPADSWLTIGKSDLLDEGSIITVEDENEPYLDRFVQSSENSGQDFVINTITGGAWYTVNGTPNGLPDENGQVLVMQFTTSGSFNGRFNIQIFPNGDVLNESRKTFIFNGVGTFSSTTETDDDDGDGVGNNDDAFPLDPTETADNDAGESGESNGTQDGEEALALTNLFMQQFYDRDNEEFIMVQFTFISNKSGSVGEEETTWTVIKDDESVVEGYFTNADRDSGYVNPLEDGSYLYSVEMVVVPGTLRVEVSFTTDDGESVNITYDDFEVRDEVRGPKTNDNNNNEQDSQTKNRT